MTEIRFYHLTSTPLEKALPRLLEKLVAGGHKILMLCPDTARMQALDAVLWTFSSKVFLPHGTAHDPYPNEQPLLLTTTPENLNHATLLVLDGGVPLPDGLAHLQIIEMFDGAQPEEVRAARARYKAYLAAGHVLRYFQQDASGQWASAE